jgi:NAD(P)-dependent dehydrogenase (short-subunit alcohol dehydrogenase family)
MALKSTRGRDAAAAPHGPVIVTGTSSGIGLETAVYLAERGFDVCATMRDLSRRQRLDAEAERRGVTLNVLQLDVTSDRSIAAAVDTALARTGRIAALVNNAGIAVRGFFEDLAAEEIRDVFEANVFGTMAVTRAVLPHMRVAGEGRIVVMSSIAGRLGSMTGSAYCASKFALEGFAEALALEVAPLGIGVSLVEPGMIPTDIWSPDRGIAARARSTRSPYRGWFEEAERLAQQFTNSSPLRPGRVARTVFRALTAPRPRMRYLVAPRARPVLALRGCLPGEWFERLYFGQIVRRVTRAGTVAGSH